MYLLRRFYGDRNPRYESLLALMEGHLTGFIHLIGSSTLPFPAVCHAQSLPATACRVEGFPDRRLFPETAVLDAAEAIVATRVHALFKGSANYEVCAQPHSATQANQAVFNAVLRDGDRMLALGPKDGGHISHVKGVPHGVEVLPIPLKADGIDWQELELVAHAVNARMIAIGATSFPLALDIPRLAGIAHSTGALLHTDLAHTAPFVAAGMHPAAFPYADTVTLDSSKNLRGPKGGILVVRRELAKSVLAALFPGIQTSPNQSGLLAKAACFDSWDEPTLYAHARRMVKVARIFASTLTAHGVPVLFGGTDSHLLMLDLRPLGITGKAAEDACLDSRIIANRNQIPDDTREPWEASGLRLGVTTLAVLEYSDEDVRTLAEALAQVLKGYGRPKETVDVLLAKYHKNLVSDANGPIAGNAGP